MNDVKKKIRRTKDDAGAICIEQIDDKDFEIPLEPDDITIGTVKDLDNVNECAQDSHRCGSRLTLTIVGSVKTSPNLSCWISFLTASVSTTQSLSLVEIWIKQVKPA